MPPIAYVVTAAVLLLVVGGIVLAYRSFKTTVDHRLPSALRRAPALPVSSTTDGTTAKVVGRVELAQPALRAPLSGKVCVCYRVRVQEEVGIRVGDSVSHEWKTRVDEQKGVDFYVHDDTGLALVRYEGAEALFDWDERYGEGTYEDESTTPELAAFLKRHDLSSKDKKLRSFEGTLEIGEQAHVLGVVSRSPGDDTIVIEKKGEEPLFIADANLFDRDREVEPC